jgi:hypothetical protein
MTNVEKENFETVVKLSTRIDDLNHILKNQSVNSFLYNHINKEF